MNESSQYWSVLLDQNPLQLDRKGIKKGKMARGVAVVGGGEGGERLLKGGNYFKYFHLKGVII